MPELEYRVMMINKENKEVYGPLSNNLILARTNYTIELIDKIGQDPQTIYINDEMVCVAFTKENVVIGFITVGYIPETATLVTDHVYVHPQCRKKGVYSLMMKRVEKFAKDIGAKNIMSFVLNTNEVSKKAHKKIGFDKKFVGYIKKVEEKDAN